MNIFKSLLNSFALMTRLPMPSKFTSEIIATWPYPIIGIIIGVITAVVYTIFYILGFSPIPCALFALAANVFITGALHYDGVSDTADGLWGGHDKDSRLGIMKKSDQGSYGSLAIFITASLYVGLINDLEYPSIVAVGIISGAIVSRCAVAWAQNILAPARNSGIAASIGKATAIESFFATIVTIVALVYIGGYNFALIITVVTLLSTLFLALLFKTKIGGNTGDTLGATQIVIELITISTIIILLYFDIVTPSEIQWNFFYGLLD